MNKKIGNITRILLLICSIGLVAVLFVPLWSIDLIAPQYPEGLVLIINPTGLAGNVDIINGLNHYIGMKTLHNEDFIEFTILPYIIGAFAALFLIVALIGRKKLLYLLVTLYILFGVVSMADFWKWEYNYGHDLDSNAAIKVPGMAYQPPLIGYKQLLNFSAYSMPATGGWIFLGVGFVSLALAIAEWRKHRSPAKSSSRTSPALASAFLLITLNSCSTAPQPIKFGTDNCDFCKMTISDNRFGAEIVSKKGRVFKFDDSHCILAYLRAGAINKKDISAIYLVDFSGNGNLINAEQAFLVQSEELRSPMGGNIAAFATKENQQRMIAEYKGQPITWKEISK